MKKLAVLLITFLFIFCDTGDMKNKATKPIGTWENSTDTYIETFQFTDTAVISTYISTNPPTDPFAINGTYQCYNTVLIFRMENGLKFFADYSINDTQLTMTFSHTGNTVIYTKKN